MNDSTQAQFERLRLALGLVFEEIIVALHVPAILAWVWCWRYCQRLGTHHSQCPRVHPELWHG